jgi:hypothetical protein
MPAGDVWQMLRSDGVADRAIPQREVAAILASRGLDVSDWLIEGHHKDICRAVSSWSPDRAIYDLGKLFFELTGPPLSEVRIYNC